MKTQICTIYLDMHIQNIKIYLVLLDSTIVFDPQHGCFGVTKTFLFIQELAICGIIFLFFSAMDNYIHSIFNVSVL